LGFEVSTELWWGFGLSLVSAGTLQLGRISP
jgi:hypothetical protein